MILEKMMANTGCMAPLMVAQMVPTRMYGHSGIFRRIILRNDTGGTSSSCRKKEKEPSHSSFSGPLSSLVRRSINSKKDVSAQPTSSAFSAPSSSFSPTEAANEDPLVVFLLYREDSAKVLSTGLFSSSICSYSFRSSSSAF